MDVLDNEELTQEGRSLESVLTEGYTFDLGDFIGKGFSLFGKDAGIYIGFCLVAFIINFVVGLVPFLSIVGGLLVGPALASGYYFYQKASNGELAGNSSFNNFFDGFKNPAWLQLVLGNLVISIFVGIIAVIVAIPLFMGVGFEFFQQLASAGSMTDPDEIQEMAAMIFGSKIFLSILILILVVMLVAVLWVLTPQFIIFKGYSFWDAMEASRKVVMKNYLKFLILLLVLGILVALGAMLCLVGLLVAVPVMYLALYAAFKHIFSNESRPSSSGQL